MRQIAIALLLIAIGSSNLVYSAENQFRYLDVSIGVQLGDITGLGEIHSETTKKDRIKLEKAVQYQFDRWYPSLPEGEKNRHFDEFARYYSYSNQMYLKQFRYYCDPCLGDINKASLWANADGQVISYLIEREINGKPNFKALKDKIFRKYGTPLVETKKALKEMYIGITNNGFTVPYTIGQEQSFSVSVEYAASNDGYTIRYAGDMGDKVQARASASEKLQSLIHKLNKINDSQSPADSVEI